LLKEDRTATDAEWDRFTDRDEGATCFHTRAWYELWRDHAGLRPDPRLLVLASGKRALLPLAYRRRRISRRKAHISSPVGTYGGFLTEEPLDKREGLELEGYLETLSGLRLRLNPFSSYTPGLTVTEPDTTLVTPLSQDFDAVFATWRAGHRRNVRIAERSGVTIDRASCDRDWEAYYQIYLASLARWGEATTSRYPASLFRLIRGMAGAALWLARYRDRIISGALVLSHNHHAVYWHGAGDADHFHLRAANLLHCCIMRDCARRGLRWYDFNPSGGHEGVARFKAGFGTEERPAGMIRR